MIKALYKQIFPESFRNSLILWGNRMKSLSYRGDTYSCNCCEKKFAKFLTHGNTPRLNAKCPWCLSLERNRLLLLFLRNETELFLGTKSLLHFAPEMCLKPVFQQSENIQYVNVDINPALADRVEDIQNLSFQDNSFDFVLCSHVLGHVPDESKAIQEVLRVLKRGGVAIFMSLISENQTTYQDDSLKTEAERLAHYGESDLLRLHGKDFASRIAAQGFEVEEINYLSQLSEEQKRQYSLRYTGRETIFFCKKP